MWSYKPIRVLEFSNVFSGAASISKGDGSRAVSEKEKAIAHYQGRHFGKIVASSVRGRDMPVATAHHSSGAKEAALGTGAATAGLATGGAVAASNLPAAIPYSVYRSIHRGVPLC